MTLDQPLIDWQQFSDQDAFDVDGLLVSSPENVTCVSEFWGLGHWARGAPPVYAPAFRNGERHVSVVVPRGSADLLVNSAPPPDAGPATAHGLSVSHDKARVHLRIRQEIVSARSIPFTWSRFGVRKTGRRYASACIANPRTTTASRLLGRQYGVGPCLQDRAQANCQNMGRSSPDCTTTAMKATWLPD
ncbi:MAG: hypothetical protein JWR85_3916 [Marmoricola sp.]|nr:hypothetical protein [Marmoricola sp.]